MTKLHDFYGQFEATLPGSEPVAAMIIDKHGDGVARMMSKSERDELVRIIAAHYAFNERLTNAAVDLADQIIAALSKPRK